jgi:PilZ domain
MSNVFQRRHMADTPGGSVLVEQRKALRYAMAATAAFVWQDSRGIQQRSEGITRDMSSSGAFIYAAVGPTEHVPARIEFELPPLEERKAPLRVRVKARVVRVERDPTDPVHSGFAVSYEGAVLRGGEEENANAQHR